MRHLSYLAILAGLAVCLWAPAWGGEGEGEGEEDASPEPRRHGKNRGQLTDEQIQQLRERAEQRRNSRTGAGMSGGMAAALDPKKANLTLVAEAFKAGEAAFKAENYPGAFEYLVDVAACAHIQGATNFADKARGRILEMEKMAAEKLEEARLKKLQGDGTGALEVLKVLREKFYFTRVAEEANNLLEALATDPRVAAAVEMLAAEDLDAAGKYAGAAGLYEAIVKKFPDSVQALKAKLRLEAMHKDEAIEAVIKEGAGKDADAKCPGLLAAARNYLANGRQDQARLLFQKVIESYPDSDYAEEAKKALNEIDASQQKAPGGPDGQQ